MGEPNIAELAVATWRLERWLDNLNAERKMAAKKSIREIKKYLNALDVEIVDPIGWRFDPGLAVEVVNNEADGVEENKLLIIQTNSPVIKQTGAVIQYGKVVLGLEIKEQKTNNELRITTDSKQTETAALNTTSDGLLSQGPIFVRVYSGFPCWVRQFNCKATKEGFRACIGIFSNVDTTVCLMDEQVYKEFKTGIAPNNPFIYKSKAGSSYIIPPYADVWYLIVWPPIEGDCSRYRFDSNCEWAINQENMNKENYESEQDRTKRDTLEQCSDPQKFKQEENETNTHAASNSKECESKVLPQAGDTDIRGKLIESDVQTMVEKNLEHLKKINMVSDQLNIAMDKGLLS